MNIILFEQSQRSEDLIHLGVEKDMRAIQHMIRVLRCKPGDAVRIGEIGGKVGTAEVVSLDEQSALLRPSALSQNPPIALGLGVVMSLPRPKNLRRCLRSLANYGVKDIHIIHSFKVEKSYWDSPLLDEDVTNEALREGLEVAGDTLFPKLTFHRFFKPFAEDVTPTLHYQSKWVLDPSPQARSCFDLRPVSVLAAIGPEGGFIPYEVEVLRARGFESVTLGSRVLTVENAMAAIASLSSHRLT